MAVLKMGIVESRFADLVWENAPLTTRELVALCAKELNWKRTTTYTVLKKLCDREIFVTQDSVVSALLTKDEYRALQGDKFVKEAYQGSLPAFIAAFAALNPPTTEELEEIKKLIDSLGE